MHINYISISWVFSTNIILKIDQLRTRSTGDVNTYKADIVDGVHGLKYETVSFTPILCGSTVSGNNNYSYNTGSYIKTNNKCHFEIYLALSAKYPNMTGNLKMRGLPFVSSGISKSVTIGDCTDVVYADNAKDFVAAVFSGQSETFLTSLQL